MTITPSYIGATNIIGTGAGPGVESSIVFSTDSGKVERITEDGNTVWTFSGGGSSFIDTSKNLNTYYSDGNRNIRELDKDGNRVWINSFPTIAGEDIAEGGGFVYIATGSTVRQLSKQNGNQQRTINFGNEVAALEADDNENVYVGTDNSEVEKYDSNGNLQWSFGGLFDLARDLNFGKGHVYAATASNFVRKINASNGTEDWNFSNGEPRATDIDADENVYIFGKQGLRKYDSNANLIWDQFVWENFQGIDNVQDGGVERDRQVLMVVDDGNIARFDVDGTFLTTIRTEGNRVLNLEVR